MKDYKRSANRIEHVHQATLHPDETFLEQLEADGKFDTNACFQCRKCTNGCPVTFAMDLYPDEVIRLVILGQRETVLGCRTIWVCAACETCTARCPNGVKIAELMDAIKERTLLERVPGPQPQILTLHRTFLKNVRKWGRAFEGTLLPAYLMQSGQFLHKWREGLWGWDIKFGWRLLCKGRFFHFPKRIKGKKEIRNILIRHKK